ncbi:hypothetical protein JZ751_003144 [Albula glossodonta]|uniref:C2H2-type domain-containing protein n=1 Tax=Albula glossodonta TaxID=121402 RepID=A0A8T2NA62_9TELE|nr:hypothetical protein JZ751_003144 [Albula glossodonta]
MPVGSVEAEPPLSSSVPRDCDHECRVCRVSVVGLTAYASHISSPLHKQRVEEQEQGSVSEAQEEEYFDKELVQLIQKRKELIQKEEGAAKRAQEEEQRKKKQQQQQQRSEERQWLKNGGPWGWGSPGFPPPRQGPGMPNWRGAGPRWNSARGHPGGPWHPSGPPGNWKNGRPSWHAQVPPNLHKWARGAWGGKNKGFQGFSPKKRGLPPQQGLYDESQSFWEKNAEPYLDEVGQEFSMDFTSDQLPLSGALHFSKEPQGIQGRPAEREAGHQGRRGGHQNGEMAIGDRGKGNGSKPGGANSKDRQFRWAPYPPAKFGDAPAQVEESKGPAADGIVPLMQVKDLNFNFDFVLGSSQSQVSSGKEPVGKSQSQRTKEGPGRKNRYWNSNLSSGSRQEDSTSAAQKSAMPSEQTSGSASPSLAPCNKKSVWNCDFSYPPKTHDSRPASPQERVEFEILRKIKEKLNDLRETSPAVDQASQQEEDPEAESSEVKAGSDKDWEAKQHRNNGGHPPSNKNAESTRRSSCMEVEFKKSGSPSPHPVQPLSLQSVQVSTSTCETMASTAAASLPQVVVEEEDREGENEKDLAIQATDEGLGSDSDAPSKGGQTVPVLSKLGLPASIKRDLTRHMGPKGKATAHEPNLNIARRIRNISGTRKSETEKDSGLKPTLRQLISSSGSRRNVNWDQVYQEVTRKKQEQGKGMPRFGIEMVTSVPYDLEGLSQEEGEEVLTEGYQWESIIDSFPTPSGTGPRKRSLSESSVVADRSSSTLSLFTTTAPRADASRQAPDGPPRPGSVPKASTSNRSSPSQVTTEKEGGQGGVKLSGQGPDLVEGDSSCTSETEQNDTQGLGKKRRAAGDIPSPEIPSLERKNKRRKIKCKKERSQVDQLLAVSLREEELSSSLQAVDSSLIQARAALQAAYMEVQRLLVVKQQVTMEMSTLRSKRIEILQGMQAAATTASALSPPFTPIVDLPVYSPGQLSPAVLPSFPQRAAPPSSLSPAHPTASTTPMPAPMPALHVKQEPSSPANLGSPAENPHRGAYGAMPEPRLNTSLTEFVQPKSSMCQSLSGLRRPSQDSATLSGVHSLDWLRETSSLQERGVLVSRVGAFLIGPEKTATLPHQTPVLPHRRDSQTTETSTGGTSNSASIEQMLPPPPSSSSQPEPKSGKRVRKLKKKKSLRKSPGQEQQADDSDTEQDGNAEASSRPVRKTKGRKKAKGVQVSTSTPASTTGLEQGGGEGEGPVQELPPSKPKQDHGGAESEDSSSPLEMVELPQALPLEVVAIDSSDAEDKPAANPVSAKTPATDDAVNLACDEVSSTSELDATTKTKACASQTQPPLAAVKTPKDSTELSSEPGEEEEPTEGSFEGHQAAVNSMQVHNGHLYTCSGDRTVRAFDLVSRKCMAVFEGHTSKVNCLLVSCGPGLQQRLYTGSSDQTIRCYNLKTRECVDQFSLPDRILCLHNRWKILFAGLANGSVVSFSLNTNRQLDVFDCHGPRAVSCLVSAQEGARRILLVGSYDCTISTGELVRIYKGHSHAVTVVAILGKVMVTACLDKLVRVYELQSHDRLQVYGGHKDMVMCMAIHKSMIYTGCYDGSVQAVRLNLIQNYRCWWHGCTLIFGVMEHLKQHLLNDHTSPNFQTLKCRWKSCDTFFTDVPLHMQKHAEEDSKLEF